MYVVPYKDVQPGELWSPVANKSWVALKLHPFYGPLSHELCPLDETLSVVVIDRDGRDEIGEAVRQKPETEVYVLTYDELQLKEG